MKEQIKIIIEQCNYEEIAKDNKQQLLDGGADIGIDVRTHIKDGRRKR